MFAGKSPILFPFIHLDVNDFMNVTAQTVL